MWQRWAARAGSLVPAPPAWERLESARDRVADDLILRRGAEIEAVRASGDRDSIARLASALVEALRRAARDAEGEPAWVRLAARLDATLDTAEEEWLDRPDVDERRRAAALARMDALNRRLGSYARFAEALAPLARGPDRATVLDLASGHAGFALALAERGLRVIASDLKSEYLDLARARESRLDIEFRVLDATRLRESIAPGSVDVVTCTQSLHHFGAGGAAVLLAEAIAVARRGVLFIDLARAVSHVAAAAVLGAIQGLAARDGLLLHDGLLSFRKAFVPAELRLIAACVPGGDTLESFYLPPGFLVLRTRVR